MDDMMKCFLEKYGRFGGRLDCRITDSITEQQLYGYLLRYITVNFNHQI